MQQIKISTSFFPERTKRLLSDNKEPSYQWHICDYSTSYNSDYIPLPNASRTRLKPESKIHLQRDLPEKGSTEYSTEYLYRPAMKPKPIIPTGELKTSDEKLSGVTTSSQQFLKYEIQKPNRYKHPEWKKSANFIEFHTSYNEDFTSKQIDRVAPIKPKNEIESPRAKFSGDPTYLNHYREWKISGNPPTRFKVGNYKPSNMPFEGNPSYNADFIPRPIVRVAPIKPKDAGIGIGAVPFSGVPEMKKFNNFPEI